MNREAFCLDPSCFVTLQRLEDTLKTLEEMTENNSKIYILTEIYNVIILEPNKKFQKLPDIIKDWLTFNPSEDIREMNDLQKRKYVETMRTILSKFQTSPTKIIADNLEKLGTHSIFRDDMIEQFGEIKGSILYEIMAVSSELKAKIIGFGRKTSLFL